MCTLDFMTIHLIVVETFHSKAAYVKLMAAQDNSVFGYCFKLLQVREARPKILTHFICEYDNEMRQIN